MQKRPIDPFDYANEITKQTVTGVLFTTKTSEETNTMVIGWGFIGTIWNKPTFVAFIRTSRHSHKLVEESGEFTINIPQGKLDPRIIKVAGMQSARHVNKLEELGLTVVEPEVVAAPAFLECPITLECKTMYTQLLDADAIPPEDMELFYPADVTDIDATGRNTYMHVAYYGHIVSSYIVEE